MNYVDRMMRAMTGPNYGLRAAWLMFSASYSYTRSFEGTEGPDGKPIAWGRWYAFSEAVKCGVNRLRRPIE